MQSISLLLYLSGCKRKCGPYLVLCPLSVLHNWQSELTRSGFKIAQTIECVDTPTGLPQG